MLGLTSTCKLGSTFFLYCSLCLLPFMCISLAFGSLNLHSQSLQLKLTVLPWSFLTSSMYSCPTGVTSFSPRILSGSPSSSLSSLLDVEAADVLRLSPDLEEVGSTLTSTVFTSKVFSWVPPMKVIFGVDRTFFGSGNGSDV